MGRFVTSRRADFVAVRGARERDSGAHLRLVSFTVDASDAECERGNEPVGHDGKVVGWVTSGAYGHKRAFIARARYIPAGPRRRSSGLRDRKSSASGRKACAVCAASILTGQ